MNMMLAELTGLEVGGLICAIAFGGGSLIIAVIALNKKQEVRVEQPLNITITEELHKVFASKPEFEKHLIDFRDKHNEVWRTLRTENQRISDEVTATREAIAGLEATSEMQNQTLASVTTDIKTILGRLPRNPNER